MSVVLKFEKPGQYEFCYTAVAMGTRTLPRGVWDLHVALLRSLRAIGKQIGTMKDGVPIMTLQDDGGEITISKSELDHLIDCVDQPMWKQSAVEGVMDTLEWLKGHQGTQLKAVE